MVRKLHVCVSIGLSLLILAVPAQRAEAQNLSISANSVAFFATQGNNPAAQSIFISPGAGLNPTIRVVTANGGAWLSVVGVTSDCSPRTTSWVSMFRVKRCRSATTLPR